MGNSCKNDINKLYKAILKLETTEECASFFNDLCTIKELEALAQRFEVACGLARNKSYIDINNETGASTATISRVGKYLRYGAEGYKTVIDRMEKDEI